MHAVWLLTGLSLLAAAVVSARGDDYPRADLLEEPTEISAEADVGVLDARPRAEYDAGHAPGARWVDHAEWAVGFGEGTDAEGWARRIGALGLERDSRVVVYDDNLSKDAARIWWILRYWGIERAALLNGGWRGWQSAGMPVETTAPARHEATTPKLVATPNRLATKSQLLRAISGRTLQIVDARSEGEHCGVEALKNKWAGAMPGAKNLEWSDLLDEQTQRFKPPNELKRLFAEAGIDLDQPTAAHCQSGGRSSVMSFGMELMGAKDVRNYYQSWSEWGNADDTPIVSGKPKGK